jgi:hypothetical protein
VNKDFISDLFTVVNYGEPTKVNYNVLSNENILVMRIEHWCQFSAGLMFYVYIERSI